MMSAPLICPAGRTTGRPSQVGHCKLGHSAAIVSNQCHAGTAACNETQNTLLITVHKYNRLIKSVLLGIVEGNRLPRRWSDDIVHWCGCSRSSRHLCIFGLYGAM